MCRVQNPSDTSRFPCYSELKARDGGRPGLAWGIFGDEDQLGTLNHITEARILEARESLREGKRFNLNLSLTEFDPPIIAHRGIIEHHVFGLNEYHRDDKVDNLFPQASTQIDSLRHFAHPDIGFYNGFPGESIGTGTGELGIHHVAEAPIVGRGILIDVDRYFRSQNQPLDHARSQRITAAELDETVQAQQTTIMPGDILMIRFGWLRHWDEAGKTTEGPVTSAGLDQSEEIAAWLWDRQVSMVAADNIAVEAWPADPNRMTTHAEASGDLEKSSHTGMLHRTLIPHLGMTLGELWNLESLAEACHDRGRYDSFVVAEPLNLFGGVGSPANAVALI